MGNTFFKNFLHNAVLILILKKKIFFLKSGVDKIILWMLEKNKLHQKVTLISNSLQINDTKWEVTYVDDS